MRKVKSPSEINAIIVQKCGQLAKEMVGLFVPVLEKRLVESLGGPVTLTRSEIAAQIAGMHDFSADCPFVEKVVGQTLVEISRLAAERKTELTKEGLTVSP